MNATICEANLQAAATNVPVHGNSGAVPQSTPVLTSYAFVQQNKRKGGDGRNQVGSAAAARCDRKARHVNSGLYFEIGRKGSRLTPQKSDVC